MTRSYLRPAVRELAGYVPGEQPRGGPVLKLNTNENPYPPSPRVVAAVRAAAGDGLRRYPDPHATALREAAAQRYHVPPERILVGNGSDEILSLVMRACVDPGTRVAYPVPTYSLYDTLVAIQEGVAVVVPYDLDWRVPAALFGIDATLTIVCHPNSPSGTGVPRATLERLVSTARGLVLVDEAYADFADETALPLLGRHDNLVVLRTFSKSFSLAGVRVGLALGPVTLIDALGRVKDSYNVNQVSLAAATAALEDYAWMEANVRRIRATRTRLSEGLVRLGFTVVPSAANFVFARRPGDDLASLCQELRARRILIRHFATPALRDGIRITVGTDDEIDTVLGAIADLVG